jgi:EpsI family protein
MNIKYGKPFFLGALMLITMIIAIVMRPDYENLDESVKLVLEEIIPENFGQWSELKTNQISQVDLLVNREGEATTDSPYDDVLMKTFINDNGEQVMLALAYGRTQKQEVKIHRPELCYQAQGFDVKSLSNISLNILGNEIPAKQMTADALQRDEKVLYWIRIGDTISQSPWQTRWSIFQQGLKGEIADGMLIRTSQTFTGDYDDESSLEIQKQFLSDLMNSLPVSQRALFL